MNETKWATIATGGNFGVRRWAEVRMSSGAVRGNCIWSSNLDTSHDCSIHMYICTEYGVHTISPADSGLAERSTQRRRSGARTTTVAVMKTAFSRDDRRRR